MPGIIGDEPISRGTPMAKGPVRTANSMVNGSEDPKPEIPNQQKSAEQKVNGDSNAMTLEVAKAQVMAQLAADPEISRILQARQTGRKVSIVDPDELADRKAQQNEEKVDWDSLSNAQMAERLPSVLSPVVKQHINDAVKPLLDELAVLRQNAQQGQSEKINSSINAAKAKYSDFDQWRPAMRELNAKNPGLNVEQLYHLARTDAGVYTTPEPTQSERPNNSTARPSIRENRKAPLPPGKRGTSQLLDEALSNMPDIDFDSEL
jgi:hypothetical protein